MTMLWKQLQIFFSAIFVLTNLVQNSEACNGYSLKLNTAKHCIPNSIIKIENPGAVLDKDCNLILTGCLVTSQSFKTATGTYSLKKAPMPPMEGNLDFCDALSGLDDPQVGAVTKMYNVPSKCPFPAGKVCGAQNKKVNLSKYKNQLGIAAGTIDLKLDLEHDTGKSCVEVNLSISRQRASRG